MFFESIFVVYDLISDKTASEVAILSDVVIESFIY